MVEKSTTAEAVLEQEEMGERLRSNLIDRPLASLFAMNWETAAWLILMIVTVVARFYDLGARAMSHDESLHTIYAYYLYDHGDYTHNPMMHGPLKFHLNALMYLLFGADDYTSRIVPAILGSMMVGTMWFFRRWLGRIGALVAGILICVSPSLLFHSRYIRDDIYIAYWAVLWVLAAFRYLDSRNARWLYLLAVSMALGFVGMEAHFITGAIFSLFFAGLLLWQITRDRDSGSSFWTKLRLHPVADLLVVMATLVLPYLSPFLHYLPPFKDIIGTVDWQNPGAISSTGIALMTILVLILLAISIGTAFFWFAMRPERRREDALPLLDFATWLRLLAIFWVIDILFFTTFLTNVKNGLASGIVGSLGYWLAQQGVQRGSQPAYYYLLIGGLYEFGPILFALSGAAVLLRNLWRNPGWQPVQSNQRVAILDEAETLSDGSSSNSVYFVCFALFWSFMAYLAYTLAGEKMPWLFTHIALPLCIFSGWWIGRLISGVDWSAALRNSTFLLMVASPAFIILTVLMARNMPTFGRDTQAISSITQWIVMLIFWVGLLYLVWRGIERSNLHTVGSMLGLGIVTLLFVLNARTSFRLTYINYDYATEYLVYAHAGPDIKRALNEIDMISERTVGERNIMVAYDDESSWPLSWYMRLYPNSRFYGSNPTQDVMQAPVIIVGPKNRDKVAPYVERDYVKRTYRLIWWPDMAYFNMTWQDVWNNITDPVKRERDWQIFFYRRFRDDTDPNKFRDLAQWPHRHEFDMYVKADIAAQIWDLGVTPVTGGGGSSAGATTARFAPTTWNEVEQPAVAIYNGVYGDKALAQPRTVAVGPNSERLIADSNNHRIVVLDNVGNFVRTFGSFCDLSQGATSGCADPDGDGPLQLGDGQFREPWGVAAAPNGDIYVADTWNGRIQVFDKDGKFLRKWGVFNTTNGELGDPNILFGPRGIQVSNDGSVFVADTGDKRILKYDANGGLISQIGGGGVVPGKFDEPTSLAIDPTDGSVFVADAWNRRIQKFGADLQFQAEWPVPGWESKEIFHKPYISVAGNGDVYVTDPQFFRIFVFNKAGGIRASFGKFGAENNNFALPNGLSVDQKTNTLLVADADNNRIMVFPLLQ
ncbi:MAG: TIGR03663 family protein [Caldilineaceae bacterium]